MTKASLAAVSLIAAIVAGSNACGEAPTAPALTPPAVQPGAPEPPPPPPPAPTPQPPPEPPPDRAAIRSLKLSGNIVLTRVGETSQLTVLGTLSDGTTKDVTSSCEWTYPLSTVATLTQNGLLTATGFGAWEIGCRFPSAAVWETVTSTPSGTFAVGARVSEPDDSDFYLDPISSVVIVDTASGRSATTDSAGRFAMGDLRGPPVRLALTKEGFERAETDVRYRLSELALQRVIRLTRGETVNPRGLVDFHDVTYTIDGRQCYPCRLIRVVIPEAGTIGVRVTWTVPATLTLFAEGQVVTGTNDVAAEVRINEPREVVMYVGGASPMAVTRYTPFTFATSVR